VDEIAVGSVDFDKVKASFEGAARAIGESVGDASDAFGSESFGLNGFRSEALCRRGIDGTLAALGDGDWSAVIAPRDASGGFKSSVGELGSGYGPVLAEEAHYTSEVLDVCVFPDAEVGGTDATLGDYGVGFGEDSARPANSASAEMDEMPVVGKAVFAGIFAHRGDGNAVAERNIADFECIEQVHSLWMVSRERGMQRGLRGIKYIDGNETHQS